MMDCGILPARDLSLVTTHRAREEVTHSLYISAELFPVIWIVANSVIVLMNPTIQRFELNTVHLYQH
jgi:hypothetical protein